jgi:hypothetical protein
VVERVYGFYRHNHQSLIAGVVERFNHANLWRVKILQIISQNPVALTRVQETDIFFDAAVISRDALMVRSRRSWCSSNSARNVSNMGRKGDCWAEGASIVSDLGRFWPICCVVVCLDFFLCCLLSVWRELLVMSLEGKAWRSCAGLFFVPHLVPNVDLLSFLSPVTLVVHHISILWSGTTNVLWLRCRGYVYLQVSKFARPG